MIGGGNKCCGRGESGSWGKVATKGEDFLMKARGSVGAKEIEIHGRGESGIGDIMRTECNVWTKS